MARRTRLEERVRIVEWAKAGLSDRGIAERLGWSQETVRKWRRRGLKTGLGGLASKMGRPRQGELSTFPAEIRGVLRQWRQAHPGWGPDTLYAELGRAERFEGQRLPSPASIGRFLRAQDLSRPYERHRELPASRRLKADEPHAVWEMDARGHSLVPEVGVVSLINLNDRFSRVRLMSYPCWLGQQRAQRQPTTEDYQVALRLTFTDWGLPQHLQVDHDSVFYDNASASPFPTRLHLWLLALGVNLTFGQPNQPTDQGCTERSHQLWNSQVLLGQYFETWQTLYLALRQRRHFLNYHLPCASLAGRPPLVAYPHAAYSSRPYRPEWEAQLLDLERVDTYLAQGRWFRLVSGNATFSLGGQVYYIGQPYIGQQLDLSFNADDRLLVCRNDTGQILKRFPLRGLCVHSLLGELEPFLTLPAFQLALPFSWDAQRMVQFSDAMGVRLSDN